VIETRPGMRAGRMTTREMVTAALLAALLMSVAYWNIPIGVVPVTLQVFVVLLAALILGPVAAGAALAVYLLVGAAGIPVFAGPAGGIGVLAGPTGGYLIGFLMGVVLGALVRTRVRGLVGDVIAVVVVLTAIYLVGWAQLAAVVHLSAGKAFLVGVAPFLALDVAKAVAAVAVANALRRAGVGLG